MEQENLLEFDIQPTEKKIFISREFSAKRQVVWDAWSKANLLDCWWAPQPWKCETTRMDFREGGEWVYAMVGPKGERHYGRNDYLSITAPATFVAYDSFCDPDGTPNTELPRTKWTAHFMEKGDRTLLTIALEFETRESLDTILQMGMQEGFTIALTGLDKLLA